MVAAGQKDSDFIRIFGRLWRFLLFVQGGVGQLRGKIRGRGPCQDSAGGRVLKSLFAVFFGIPRTHVT